MLIVMRMAPNAVRMHVCATKLVHLQDRGLVCPTQFNPRYAQVWACTRVDPGSSSAAACPSPPDLACFIYDEEAAIFVYWGPNSALRLVTLAASAATRQQQAAARESSALAT